MHRPGICVIHKIAFAHERQRLDDRQRPDVIDDIDALERGLHPAIMIVADERDLAAIATKQLRDLDVVAGRPSTAG